MKGSQFGLGSKSTWFAIGKDNSLGKGYLGFSMFDLYPAKLPAFLRCIHHNYCGNYRFPLKNMDCRKHLAQMSCTAIFFIAGF